MISNKSSRSLRVALFTSILTASVLLVGCNRGGTGSGEDVELAEGPGSPYVSDGGSGSQLTLTVSNSILIGERKPFSVRAVDPDGQPLAFVQIICDTEAGLAITEPTNGSVAIQSTNADGHMSGQIGGLTPGSYLMECRAAQGFNIFARAQVVVRGDVPDGFDGFAGAAGGGLGGRRVPVEPEPSA